MFIDKKQNKFNYNHVTRYTLHVTRFAVAIPFLLIIMSLLLPLTASGSDTLDFKPQVGIPGSQFKEGATLPVFGNLVMLAMYIKSIYTYLIGISGIVAAVVIMAGGVFWLTAGGDTGKIKEAQSWIKGGLMGLVLIIASYTILATINPALVDLNVAAIKSVSDSATAAAEVKKFPILSQIVPGTESFDLGSLECNDDICSTTWIAQTVNGVYRYALGIVGILAAIMIMVGGVIWLTAGGDAGKVSQAQDYIKGAVMGLVLVIASYTILYQLNPALVNYNPINIVRIEIFEINITPGGQATITYSNGTKETFNTVQGLQIRGKSGTYMMQPGLARELNYLAENYGGMDVSSIFRTNSNNHVTGDSADLPTSSNGNQKLLKVIDYYMQNPSKVRQLIYQDPNTGKQYGILNGKITSNGQTGTPEFSSNYSGHKDHIHLSIY